MSNNSERSTSVSFSSVTNVSIRSTSLTALRDDPPQAINMSSSLKSLCLTWNKPSACLSSLSVKIFCSPLVSVTPKTSFKAYLKNSLIDMSTSFVLFWASTNREPLSTFPWAVIGRWEIVCTESGQASTGKMFSMLLLKDDSSLWTCDRDLFTTNRRSLSGFLSAVFSKTKEHVISGNCSEICRSIQSRFILFPIRLICLSLRPWYQMVLSFT